MIPYATAFQNDAFEDRLTGGILPSRVLAFVIDGVIVTVLAAALWVVLLVMGLLTLGLLWPLFALLPAVPVLYNWLTVAGRGQATPGQAMCGLRVVRDTDLGRPNSAQALVWAAGFAVTIALGAVWLAVALITTRHRAAHDIVAGVTVVRRIDSPLTEGPRRANIGPGNIWAA